MNFFKTIIITSPILAVLLFLLLIYSKKMDVNFKKENIKFDADWNAFEKTFAPEVYSAKKDILKKKKKELFALKSENNQLSIKENELLKNFEKNFNQIESDNKKNDNHSVNLNELYRALTPIK